VVTVDDSALEFYEFSTITQKKIKVTVLPLASIKSVRYIFSPGKEGSSRILLMTEKDFIYAERYKSDPFKMMADAVHGRNQPVTIDVHSINPVESLFLESWLQEKIGSSAL
jgi:hypothetical protein